MNFDELEERVLALVELAPNGVLPRLSFNLSNNLGLPESRYGHLTSAGRALFCENFPGLESWQHAEIAVVIRVTGLMKSEKIGDEWFARWMFSKTWPDPPEESEFYAMYFLDSQNLSADQFVKRHLQRIIDYKSFVEAELQIILDT